MFIILFYWALSVTCDSAERPLSSWILYFPGFDFTTFSRYFPKHFFKIFFLSCLNVSVPLDFIFGPQLFSIFYTPWVISIILLVLTLIMCWWLPNLPQSSKVDLNIQLPSLVHHTICSHGSFFFLPLCKDTYLPFFEVLLELLLHGGQLLGLYPTVGQQHATKLPLSNSPIHRVMAFKLKGKHRVFLRWNDKYFDMECGMINCVGWQKIADGQDCIFELQFSLRFEKTYQKQKIWVLQICH